MSLQNLQGLCISAQVFFASRAPYQATDGDYLKPPTAKDSPQVLSLSKDDPVVGQHKTLVVKRVSESIGTSCVARHTPIWRSVDSTGASNCDQYKVRGAGRSMGRRPFRDAQQMGTAQKGPGIRPRQDSSCGG